MLMVSLSYRHWLLRSAQRGPGELARRVSSCLVRETRLNRRGIVYTNTRNTRKWAHIRNGALLIDASLVILDCHKDVDYAIRRLPEGYQRKAARCTGRGPQRQILRKLRYVHVLRAAARRKEAEAPNLAELAQASLFSERTGAWIFPFRRGEKTRPPVPL